MPAQKSYIFSPARAPSGGKPKGCLRRSVKGALILASLLILIPVLAVLGAVGYYRSIVGKTPGRLTPPHSVGELARWVDPFIGTGGVPWVCAYNSPCATVPFGGVRLGPDTSSILINAEGLNSSGYYYGDNRIIGFSHNRLLGADAFDGGNFRVFPSTVPFPEQVRPEDSPAKFSHSGESASPGWYAVVLEPEDIRVDLTATHRVGVHRYTFPPGTRPHLSLDVSSSLGDARTREGTVRIHPASGEMEGSIKNFGSFSGRYGGLTVYFAARFSPPFEDFAVWNNGNLIQGATEERGDDLRAGASFAPRGGTQSVELRLALSCVSAANARMNLDQESEGLTFEEIVRAADALWEKRLEGIRIHTADETLKRIYYTALYRAFQMPTTFEDVNHEYLGFDGSIHRSEGFTYYTDFSLWDTFRTVHPLYNLIAPDDQRDMLESLLAMAEAGGCFPRWPSGAGYTNCMIGTPADILVAEAYQKGIKGFDYPAAYEKLRQTALTGKPEGTKFAGRQNLEDYIRLGYCPSDKMSKAVGQTLEFAYSDFALAQLAAGLGRIEDASVLLEHSRSYRNVWNPESQYFQPRTEEGAFEPIDPLLLSYTDSDGKLTDDFIEGSALQWRWVVPFDFAGLVSLFKSPESFVEELEAYFEGSNKNVGNWNPGPYYWHGNEPYIHSAYLFNAAGRPDLTQKWVRWILQTKYTADYVGLDGNDDGGTLSAWYVWSAMGIYPIAGTTRYELGAPILDGAEINLGSGSFRITAMDQSPENRYVDEVRLNGAVLDRTWIDHEEIQPGGLLEFTMSPLPPGVSVD